MSGTGCPAAANRTGPDGPSAPRGTAITPSATRFPSAARAASPIALPAFPAPTRWIFHRDERGIAALTPSMSSTTASPSPRSADATRRAGSTAATAARNARSSRSFSRGFTGGASDRLAIGQPALEPAGQLREGEAHDEVDDRDEDEDLGGGKQRPVLHLGGD